MDAGALAAEQTIDGRRPGWRLRVSIALGENFFLLAVKSILSCVSDPTIFLFLFVFFSSAFSPLKMCYLGFKIR